MNISEIDPLQVRIPEYPVEPFILQRWSARAMSGEPLEHEQLLRLFEAARWAPSAANRQEWYFLYAHRDTPTFDQFFSLLDEGNQAWCQRAAVLIVVLARTKTDTGRNIGTYAFDTGAACLNLAHQAISMGLVVHPMAGFDAARTREELHVPEDFAVLAMLAVGHPGEIEDLPPHQQERETPSLRNPVAHFIHEGAF